MVPMTYTCLMVGSPGVGKTSYIRRLTGSSILTTHVSTMIDTRYQYMAETAQGRTTFVLIDTCPAWNIDDYVDVDCVLLMYDGSDNESTLYQIETLKKLKDAGIVVPVLMIDNKCDQMTTPDAVYVTGDNQYELAMSVMNCKPEFLVIPFNHLASHVAGDKGCLVTHL